MHYYFEKPEAFINEINDFEAFLSGNENIDSNVIPVNAESSKKRLKNEIEKRLLAINNENLLNQFSSLDKNGKNIMFVLRYMQILSFNQTLYVGSRFKQMAKS